MKYKNLLIFGLVLLVLATFVSAVDSITSGLVAYYTLGGDAIDSSGNNYHGTIYGTISGSSTSKLGQAMYSDGTSGNKIKISSLGLSTTWTVGFWIKTTTTNRSYILDANTGGDRVVIGININGNYISVYDGVNWHDGTTQINDGNWHYVVVSMSGTTLTINVDNSNDYTTTSANSRNLNGTIALFDSEASNGSELNAYLDEIGIWNKVLSSSEILELYALGSGARPDILKLGNQMYYSFDDGTATDLSGNGNNGTISGATSTTGLLNNSMSFDGNNNYISSDLVLTQTDDWSMGGWFYITDTTTQRRIGLYNGDSANDGFGIAVTGTDNTKYSVLYGGVAWNDFSTTNVANSWVFLVAERKDGVLKLYVNNVQDTTTYTNTPNSPSGSSYVGGDLTENNKFQGNIDEPFIYNRLLANDEISLLYNSGAGYNPYASTTSNNLTITTNTNNFTVDIYNSTINYTFSTTTGNITTNISINNTQTYNIKIYNASDNENRPYFSQTYNSQTFNTFNYTFTANLNPYMKINATNLINGSKITNFNVTYNANTYQSDNNGNVFLPSYNELIDFTVSSNSYFDINVTGHNSTSDYTAEMYQAIDQFYVYDKISGQSLQGYNVTIAGITKENNSLWYINSRQYNVTISKAGYYDKNITINDTLLSTNTHNESIFNHKLNITLNDIENKGDEDIFQVTVYSLNFSYSESLNTTNGTIIANLSHGPYRLYLHGLGWADQNYTVNLTENNTYTNYSMDAYTTNSIVVYIYDGSTGNLITDNTTITITGNNTQYINETINGHYYIDNLNPGEYTVTFDTTNYLQSEYVVTVYNNSVQYLNAYMYNSNSTVYFVVKKSGTTTTIDGATITLEKYVNGSLVLVASKQTDVTGTVSFNYNKGVAHKFTVTASGYQDKSFTLSNFYYSTYNIYLNAETETIDISDYSDVSIYYYDTNFYEDIPGNFTFVISNSKGELQEYSVTLTYPGGSITKSGTNAYGETFILPHNITGASFLDQVSLTYSYKTVYTDTKTFTKNFGIVLDSGESKTLISNKDNSYGLGIYERALITVLLVIIIGGSATLFGGVLAGGTIGLFLLGFFVYIGFIPMWSAIISLFVGFFLLVWRSAQ